MDHRFACRTFVGERGEAAVFGGVGEDVARLDEIESSVKIEFTSLKLYGDGGLGLQVLDLHEHMLADGHIEQFFAG